MDNLTHLGLDVHKESTAVALLRPQDREPTHRVIPSARRAGLDLSPTEMIEALAAIREVTLLYPPAKGKGSPRVLSKLTRMDQTQQALFELFQLDAFAPRVGNTAK